MCAQGLQQAQQKMRDDHAEESAIRVFAHYYRQVETGATGLIEEREIQPLLDVPRAADLEPPRTPEHLARTVLIRLNGGLATSMGMSRAKSLLPIRGSRTFIDLIAHQVQHARSAYGVTLPLLLMNSFRTHHDSLRAIIRHPDLAVDGLPQAFVQSRQPKLSRADLAPIQWPADAELEWCPNGHGDLYRSIFASGLLDRLLTLGYKYAQVSNADNLGAVPNASLAAWFGESGAPYAAELCRRTSADRKGGHLAVRREDGRVILRDTAQTPTDEMRFFTDTDRHPFFHTNNLWFDLAVLRDTLGERGGILGLPLIVNTKTVDPKDASSPEVVQLETAMGAAIELFDGARAIEVGRDRFLPVKTTNDLLLVRSDAYCDADDGSLVPVGQAPQIDLDPRFYRTLDDFDRHFPAGPPSLRDATRLSVSGDWTFGADVRIHGALDLEDAGTPQVTGDSVDLGDRWS